jgi:hypothetical protein
MHKNVANDTMMRIREREIQGAFTTDANERYDMMDTQHNIDPKLKDPRQLYDGWSEHGSKTNLQRRRNGTMVADDTMDKKRKNQDCERKLQDNFYDESGRYDVGWEETRRSKTR